ncbi:unnamed protein product [Allacma fusca]|uniref:Uncharacterized protein n=1 Tax=Allacma fusca TaxID=39272 RepID=A0A8J2KUT4_9HEXA|nr:unnamed protein product [Allacma fusca]
MAPTVTAEVGYPSSQKMLNVSNGKPGSLPGSPLTGSAQLCVSSASTITRIATSDREDVIQQKLAVLSQQVKTVKEERNQHLMSMCLKTLELSSKNRKLQEELNELREQTRKFVQSLNRSPPGCPPQMTKSMIHVPLMKTARSTLATLPVPDPLSLNFPTHNSSSFVQFQSIGSTTSFTPLPAQQPNDQKPCHVPTAQMSTSQIQSTTLTSCFRSPGQVLSPEVQTAIGKSMPAPVYKEGINTIQLQVDQNLNYVPLSTNISTISSDTSGTIGSHDQSGDATATSDPEVFCSCCSEDDGQANQNNFYTLLNDLASSWINRLHGNKNSISPAIHVGGLPEDTTREGSPSQKDCLQKKELLETVSPQNYLPLQIPMSRKRYMSNNDEDPMISAKRRCNGTKSSFESYMCASPLLSTSDSEDGMGSLRVDTTEMMQLNSMDELGLSDDSD